MKKTIIPFKMTDKDGIRGASSGVSSNTRANTS